MHIIKAGGKQNTVSLEIKLKINNFSEITTEDLMHSQNPIDKNRLYS